MRWVLVLALLLPWYPAVAAAPELDRPAVGLAIEDGRPVFSLDSRLPWKQAIVERLGPTRWSIVWAGSDGTAGGVWRYTVVIDGPEPGPDPPGPDPEPDPEPNPWKPAERWRPVVKPLLAFDLEREDATAMGNLYGTAAAQVAAGALTTTLELRQHLVEHGVKLGLQGKYPGLADTMDKIQAEALGLDVKPLNAERAAEYLETLAWACWEAGR